VSSSSAPYSGSIYSRGHCLWSCIRSLRSRVLPVTTKSPADPDISRLISCPQGIAWSKTSSWKRTSTCWRLICWASCHRNSVQPFLTYDSASCQGQSFIGGTSFAKKQGVFVDSLRYLRYPDPYSVPWRAERSASLIVALERTRLDWFCVWWKT